MNMGIYRENTEAAKLCSVHVIPSMNFKESKHKPTKILQQEILVFRCLQQKNKQLGWPTHTITMSDTKREAIFFCWQLILPILIGYFFF